MKLNIKKLPDQANLEVEVADDATAEDLKRRIQADHGHDVSWQKLIFAGRIVPNESLLAAVGIKDGSSLVLVVRSPEAGPTPVSAAPSSTAPSSVSDEAAPRQPSSSPTPPAAESSAGAAPPVAEVAGGGGEATPAAAQPEATAATPQGGEAAPAGTQQPSAAAFTPSEEATATLLGMGFEQEQIVRALRLAENNVQNACDLLLSGAPLTEATAPSSAAASASAGAATGATPATDPQHEATLLMNDLIRRMQQQTTDPQAQFEWVVQQTQFQRIRSLLQTRPDLFNSLLSQLGASNPQLYELISQNRAEFLEWLNEENLNVSGAGGAAGGGGATAPAATQQQQQGGQQAHSQRDEAAITRLMELGFGREAVREAYLACGRNEEMAANYLFEN